MMRIMMKSKIHRATVTQADLDYVGSVTLDAALMEAADLLEGEQVAIVDITNGARIETYVIPGPRGSGVIGINGAAARARFGPNQGRPARRELGFATSSRHGGGR